MPAMNTTTAARLDIVAAALPPDAAAAVLSELRALVADLPSVCADADAARAAELGPLVAVLRSTRGF